MPPWNAVVPLVTALGGMLVALYVKDKAHEVAREEYSKSISASLATFKNDLLETLDKTYVRAGEYNLRMESQDDRIDIADLRTNEIEKRLNLFPINLSKVK